MLQEPTLRVWSRADVKQKKTCLEIDKAWYTYDVEDEDAPGQFTVFDYADDAPERSGPAPRLLDHPYLANRFFSTPRISVIDVDDGKVGLAMPICNEKGVLVLDVYFYLTFW